MGGKVEHPLKVGVWVSDKAAETIATARNAIVGAAACKAAVKERPGGVVILRRGSSVIRTTKPEPQSPPTVAMLMVLGVNGARLRCVGCGRHATMSWEALRAQDEEPFPTCGRRLTCSACGGRQVQRMPDWR